MSCERCELATMTEETATPLADMLIKAHTAVVAQDDERVTWFRNEHQALISLIENFAELTHDIKPRHTCDTETPAAKAIEL